MAEADVERGAVTLLDSEQGVALKAAWAGRLLALGARLARRPLTVDSQLVVGLVLPARDYAALLISAGWILAQPPVSSQQAPQCEAERLDDRLPVPVRMAVGSQIIAGLLYSIRREPAGMRIHVGNTYWHGDKITHMEAAQGMSAERFGRFSLTTPGSLVRWTGHADSWAAEHCRGAAGVAVIGTRSVLLNELELPVGWSRGDGGLQPLRAILRPDDGQCPSWASSILPGGTGDMPDVPAEAALVVLDDASATRWLPVIEAPVVVTIIDGGSADEAAEDTLLRVRSTGRPVPLATIGWTPSPGIQALAFEVPL